MPRSRLIKRTAVCAMLGLVTTVLVAWSFAAWGSVGVRSTTRGSVIFTVPKTELWGHAFVTKGIGGVQRFNYWRGTAPAEHAALMSPEQFGPLRSSWGLSANDRAERVTSDAHELTREWAFGFPMPALWLHQDIGPAGTIEQSGIPVPIAFYKGTKLRTIPPRALPLSPAWFGLIVNTLVFGGLWWFVLFGVPAIRAKQRMDKGLCPKCTYDLIGDLDSGCPECGWGRDGKKSLGADAGIA